MTGQYNKIIELLYKITSGEIICSKCRNGILEVKKVELEHNRVILECNYCGAKYIITTNYSVEIK